MDTTLLFLVILCIFLVVGLGINYSNIFNKTITNMKTYKPTPISSTKYNSPDDYYLDPDASQGVFASTVQLNTHILEPMVSGSSGPPQPNTTTTNGANAPNGSVYTNAGATGPYCLRTAYGCCKDGTTVKNAAGNNCVPDESNVACKSSKYGCCLDRVTPSIDENGSNCSQITGKKPGGCEGTQYGCCPDGVTAKNSTATNCAPVGGCEGTRYGCCPDGVTAKNSTASNCASVGGCQPGFVLLSDGSCAPPGNVDKHYKHKKGCSRTQYGCCADGKTYKNEDGSNCTDASIWKFNGPKNSGYVVKGPNGNVIVKTKSNCAATEYGCCLDGTTTKNATGSNCPPVNAWKFTGPNVTAYAGKGPNNSGFIAQGPFGNTVIGVASNCSMSQYGCCPDNVTTRNMNGSNCLLGGCAGTQYGCCPDNVTARNVNGSNCAVYPPLPQPTTSTVFIPPPRRHCHTHEDNTSNTNNTNNTANTLTPDKSQIPVQTNDVPKPNFMSSLLGSSNEETVPSTASCPPIPPPPPCPPCGRCPEPSFDCKKVPNYASTNSEYLPSPVLSDFSQFGM